VSDFWRNSGTDSMIFKPSDKSWSLRPYKYHAINSVYYSFSIQVYDILSIQVHIIIHIVLLCLLGCMPFVLRCWLILGHNFYPFNLSNIHVIWGLGCILVGMEWWVVVAGGDRGWGSSWGCTITGPLGSWSLLYKCSIFPHIWSWIEISKEAGGPSPAAALLPS